MKLLRGKASSDAARAIARASEDAATEQAAKEMRTVVHTDDRRRSGSPGVSVLRLEPEIAAGERVGRTESDLVEETLTEQLRREDRYCAMDDNSYVIVLAATADDEGLVVAERLASQVTLRLADFSSRTWRTSVATYPRDAKTQRALVQLSHDPARRVGLR